MEVVENVFTDGERRLWCGPCGCCRCIGVGAWIGTGKMLEEVVRVRECGVQSDSVAEIAAETCMTQATCLRLAPSVSKRSLERTLDIHL